MATYRDREELRQELARKHGLDEISSRDWAHCRPLKSTALEDDDLKAASILLLDAPDFSSLLQREVDGIRARFGPNFGWRIVHEAELGFMTSDFDDAAALGWATPLSEDKRRAIGDLLLIRLAVDRLQARRAIPNTVAVELVLFGHRGHPMAARLLASGSFHSRFLLNPFHAASQLVRGDRQSSIFRAQLLVDADRAVYGALLATSARHPTWHDRWLKYESDHRLRVGRTFDNWRAYAAGVRNARTRIKRFFSLTNELSGLS